LIAVIVPVLSRPTRAQPLVDSLAGSTDQARAVFVCSPGDDDQLAASYATGAETIIADWQPERADWARKCELARNLTDEPFLLLGADDIHFHPGWADAVLAIFDAYDVGVVGTNDLANPTVKRGLHSTHPVVCRGYADAHGTIDEPLAMLPTCYWHNWVDAELVETAKTRGCWAFAPDARVEHAHPFWHTAVDDDTYRRGRRFYEEDAQLFRERQRLWTQVAA
jgi:hypothetical protein